MGRPDTTQHAMFSYRSLEERILAKKPDSSIDGRTPRHTGYAFSMNKRKLAKEIYVWAKTVGGLHKTRLIGLAKVAAQTDFILACYNLTRIATLFGWRLSAV